MNALFDFQFSTFNTSCAHCDTECFIVYHVKYLQVHFLRESCIFLTLLLLIVCTVCSCHVTYMFQSESTLYSYLNVKEHLARSRREIWRLSDCNWTRTQNHLVRKRTLNHLVKLAKWLSCVLSTYLYGASVVILGTKWFWVRVQLQSLFIVLHNFTKLFPSSEKIK